MTNLIIIALFVLAAVVLAVWALILKGKEDMLSKKEVAMEEQKEKLQKMRDALTADERSFDSLVRGCRTFLDNAVEITASYTVTESDELKYSTEEAVRKAAIKSMRFALANDISSKFEPVEEVVDGKRKYVYRFKVIQDDVK